MRYFVFFFSFTNNQNQEGFGEQCLTCKGFPSRANLAKTLADKHKVKIESIVFTSPPLELSKEEFKNWNGE